MISKIEMQAMDAVIGIHREMRKANEIDWEQRRYEIAKSMLPVVRSNSSGICKNQYNVYKTSCQTCCGLC